ncbi:MAG: hypothetical protein KF829_01375 [Ferruginibacter sp.]|nr:hypothetical protein [Ferruginibacter sp.]
MRDKRITFLLLLSFLLLFSAFLVLVVWGYKFYSTKEAQLRKNTIGLTDTQERTRDSLFTLYTQTIGSLEQKLSTTYSGADSLGKTLDNKLVEYYKLKDELTSMLKNSKSTEDFEAALLKIKELQHSLQSLQKTNRSISSENQRLNQLLLDLQANINRQGSPVEKQPNANPIETNTSSATNHSAIETPITSSSTVSTAVPKANPSIATPKVYTASNLSIERVSNGINEENMELVGSFLLQNNSNRTANDDLMIVVIQPNGKVLQKSAWESGTFQALSGKKIYSCKLSIENLTPGRNKIVTFSLQGDKTLPGIYTVEIYQRGMLIGNLYKRV